MKNLHPSLTEVLEEKCLDEWLDLPISRLYFNDFADSENEAGDISSPSLSFLSVNISSEFGTFSFDKVSVDIIETSENELQELKGKHPLGVINYYEESCPTVVLHLTEKTINRILQLLSQGSDSLKIRVAIPKWKDKESKCLPLVKYQFFYERKLQQEPP